MALGKLIYEAKGQQTGLRVLPDGKVESSERLQGKFLGHEGMEVSTVVNEMRPDGSLFGNVTGMFVTKDGHGMSFKGQGIGWWKPDGSLTFRGAVYFWSPSPKLAEANGVAGVYEVEADPSGSVQIKTWEWK